MSSLCACLAAPVPAVSAGLEGEVAGPSPALRELPPPYNLHLWPQCCSRSVSGMGELALPRQLCVLVPLPPQPSQERGWPQFVLVFHPRPPVTQEMLPALENRLASSRRQLKEPTLGTHGQ